MTFRFVESPAMEALQARRFDSYAEYMVRRSLIEVSMLADYDELICLDSLTAIDKHWYQIETARKVMRQLGGRALLCDEVGLGKTIEAALILSEYLARGMVDSVLILTPASLVSQWSDELSQKFGIRAVTTDDRKPGEDPASFWNSHSRIVASLHTAKSAKHAASITARTWDMVIVDEAHHLRNRRTLGWQLVNSLKMRFVLMLTATPLQNSLIELYNLLTLLKPGLLQTEAHFRKMYIDPTNPRKPKNPEQLRRLMREVMVRNTRSLVDVALPKRYAATIRIVPSAQEQAVYDRIAGYIQTHAASIDRFSKASYLSRAGSSLAAVKSTLEGSKKQGIDRELREMLDEIDVSVASEKAKRLVELLKKSNQKTIVFSNHRSTGTYLAKILAAEGIVFREFLGGMSLKEKDAAIDGFRDEAMVLLASETAGEGRNIQFANTIINYDLPWNPMQIEQRIGRVHRIGQTQDVYVFNFCLVGSVEEYILHVLHEKINMFELIVGEIETIIGDLDEDMNFAEVIVDLWLAHQSPQERIAAFDQFADKLIEVKERYHETQALEQEVFGSDFEAA